MDPCSSRRILLVDDDRLILKITETMLQRAGYEVVVAASGDEALKYYKKSPSDFKLIVTDMRMPGLTGPELAEHIHSMGTKIPILFMSGYPVEPKRDKGEWSSRVIAKPFTARDFVRTVSEAVA